MNNISKKWLRYLLQWGTLLAIVAFAFKIFGNEKFDPEAYCPFGGLETLGSYLVKGTLACSMTSVQIMMGVALAIGVVLFSRLFCSYICPLGTIVEYLGKLRTKLKIKGLEITPWSVADKILRIVKYILLFTIFYFTISSSELFCKNFDPYYAVATGFKGEITLWMVYISITLFILGSFFIKMFWCRYICPLGAISNIFKFTLTFILILGIYIVLSLFGVQISWKVPLIITCVVGYINEVIFKAPKIFPLLHISRNEDACNKCGVCTKNVLILLIYQK
jgi:Polyferredoxin